MKRRTARPALLLAALACLASPARAAAPRAAEVEFFEKRIRPVLVEHCQGCHGPKGMPKGGLRVDHRDGLRKGGESGPAVVPGKVESSRHIKADRYADESLQMPPEGKLPARVIADLEKWVADGAYDPRDKAAPVVRVPDAAKHWAFQAVRTTAPPAVRDAAWARTPVDRFLLAKLEARRLSPAPEADRLTLVRRLTFDLTGLPPTPEEVDAFVNDRSGDAYEKLVDRLLASPAYGERWGRHWLDLARYADTAGETADIPAPHAWRYRNYVLDAFNADTPYDRFVREQIAGDILARTAPAGERAKLVVATGYLAVSRRFGFDVLADHYLTIEDTIDTLGKSVLGLTVSCARCHDHKYDPITAKDYYALYGIFESTRYPFSGCEKDRKPRDLVALGSPQQERHLAAIRKELAALDADLAKANEGRGRIARAFKEAGAKARVLAKGEIADGGQEAFGDKIAAFDVKPGQLILLSVAPGANHGADSTLVEWEVVEEGGKKRRWSVHDLLDDLLAGNPHAGRDGVPTWCFLDLRDGPALLAEPVKGLLGKPGLNAWRRGDTPSVWVNAGRQPVSVWTTLPPRSFFVHPGQAGPVGVAWISPLAGKVRVKGRLADAHKGGPDGVRWRLEHLAAPLGDLRDLAKVEARIGESGRKKSALEKQLAGVPLAYAVQEGSPHDAQIHLRGDPEKRGAAVPRRFLTVLGGQTLPSDEKGSGRLHLAKWLTDPKNPLTARVMVNRLWQHHFGRGLVATPSDFGTRGSAPSHPELLDYLATRFVEGGWSIKAMHRLIVLSAAYRQSGLTIAALVKADPDNELLGRFARRRLSAEEIRDSILSASGSLDRTPGGPHPFPDEKTWNYTQHNPFTAAYDGDRRAVYLMVQRIKRHPFLGLFDGADPSSSTATRDSTTVPTQALFFLNDPFVHTAADRLAARLLSLSSDAARIDEVHRRCLGRRPTERERQAAGRFVSGAEGEAKQRWASWVRVVMASNEFVYVD